MDFSPDQANPYYDPNYNTPDPKSSDERKARIERREKALKGRMPPRIIPRDKMREAAEAMEDEPSLDPRKSCTGIFCRLFSGGKRRTKKRRKKRRTKSRRKTKRRRKSRRRTKRRRRKR